MRKILIIEDNPNIRENLEELLELSNFEVDTATNGLEGIHSIQVEKPDLILCDVHMPKMNGYQVLEFLKTELKTVKIPFVFITSSSQKREIEKGIHSGADSFLVKPFKIEILQDTIEKLLRSN